MNHDFKKYFFLILLLVFSGTTKPISENAAIGWSVVAGSATGLVAGGITYKVLNNGRKVIPVAVGVGVGGLAGYWAYSLLYNHTPQGRYLKAKVLIDGVANDGLVCRKFKRTAEMISYAMDRFGTKSLSNSLGLAQTSFQLMINNLQQARKLLNDSALEADNNLVLKRLADKCRKYAPKIEELLSIIKERMCWIIERKAKMLIDDVANDSLVKSNFESTDKMISHATARFGTSWPLVLARTSFEKMRNKLQQADELLNRFALQADGNTRLKLLADKCKSHAIQIEALLNIIEDRMCLIVEHKDYRFQVELYERHKEEERKRRLQAKMHAEMLLEEEKKRADQAKIHAAQIWQKYEDRWHKEKLLNQATNYGVRPVNQINLNI